MELPDSIALQLNSFLDETRRIFSDRLVSIVLYGSAAEGKLRPSSDVNLIVVTKEFKVTDASALNSSLTLAHDAIGLQVMFLLESELSTAKDLFAVKFLDISRRRQVLYGTDPFASIDLSRSALINRVRQVLLNQLLRLRSAISLSGDSVLHLRNLLTENAAPLRAVAGAILELQNRPFENPKQALELLASEMRSDGYKDALHLISNAREGQAIGADEANAALQDILELSSKMKELVKSLSA